MSYGTLTGRTDRVENWKVRPDKGEKTIILRNSYLYDFSKKQGRAWYDVEEWGMRVGWADHYLPLRRKGLDNVIAGFLEYPSLNIRIKEEYKEEKYKEWARERLAQSLIKWVREIKPQEAFTISLYDPSEGDVQRYHLATFVRDWDKEEVRDAISKLNCESDDEIIVYPSEKRGQSTIEVRSFQKDFKMIIHNNPLQEGIFFIPIDDFFSQKEDIENLDKKIYQSLIENIR